MLTRSIVCRALVGAGLALAVGAPALAQEAVTLKYKWTKGDVLHYRWVQESKAKRTAAVGEQETITRQEFVHRYEVKEVGADGVATLDYSVVSMRIDSESTPGAKVSYDSTKPNEKPDSPNRNAQSQRAAYEAVGMIVGEHISVVIEPGGAVRKVEGMARVLEKIQSKANLDPRALGNLRNSLSDAGVRTNLERIFKVLPEKSVKPGDTWTASYEQAIPNVSGKMRVESTWTFAGPDKVENKPTSKLTSALKLETLPPKEGEEGGPTGVTTTLKDGTGTGETNIDGQAGQLVKSAVSLKFLVDVSIGGMGFKDDTTTKSTYERIPAPPATPKADAKEEKKEETKK